MSRFQLKILHHTKNQKDFKLRSQTKERKSIGAIIEMTQMFELPNGFQSTHYKNALTKNFEHA